tara:strand:+ start:2070 stop:2579 length:510 start_codon:yes stop_codon:yes gene_type:complete
MKNIFFYSLIGFFIFGCDNFMTDCDCDDGDDNDIETELPVEEYFAFNVSSKVSYYWFETVLINGNEIESDDWVAAFNGDICVGSQQWICPGNCNLPVYGENELNELTEGYMLPGELPSFKIYDTSENMYYDAMPTQEFEWQNGNLQNQFQADTLSSQGTGGRGGGTGRP